MGGDVQAWVATTGGGGNVDGVRIGRRQRLDLGGDSLVKRTSIG
jgi:hypothetical protein